MPAVEVYETANWWAKFLGGPLPGVFVGALLAFLASLFNDRKQENKERSRRRRWVRTALPAFLESDQIAVMNEQAVDVQLWLGRLVAEGYYFELSEALAKSFETEVAPSNFLIVGAQLRTYQNLREKGRLADEFKQDLVRSLTSISGALRRLSEK